jgi:hypothetical protein
VWGRGKRWGHLKRVLVRGLCDNYVGLLSCVHCMRIVQYSTVQYV